ncbi:MAG: DUF1003 domain-containing protein [Intrasporangium sp.]|uniref:DUF1003 domain-containing protein n=1 Tax=Intrasporangium sp. TaxID=1925024 RepID=UPI003F7DA712
MSDQPTRAPRRTDRLDQPREQRASLFPRVAFSQEAFGIVAEKFARFMGTAKFLAYMTVFIIVWIAINAIGIFGLHFDPYPFILLNLFFSTQASYAAPLILLAQNRQADRDRVAIEQDRARDERNLADTEYLTREVASLRLALREQATRDFVRSELRDLLGELEERQLIVPREDARPPDGPHRQDSEGAPGGEVSRYAGQPAPRGPRASRGAG